MIARDTAAGPRRQTRRFRGFRRSRCEGRAKHRAVVGKGVELAVFAARIDRCRQFRQQGAVELAAREPGGEGFRIDAGKACAHPATIISRARAAVGVPKGETAALGLCR